MSTLQPLSDRQSFLGTLRAFAGFLVWGLLPFYWNWLGEVEAIEILAHRIIWSAILLIVVVCARTSAIVPEYTGIWWMGT
ncbi:MAG: hypothetical protein ACOC0E_13840 [Spirochaetota bacterium]